MTINNLIRGSFYVLGSTFRETCTIESFHDPILRYPLKPITLLALSILSSPLLIGAYYYCPEAVVEGWERGIENHPLYNAPVITDLNRPAAINKKIPIDQSNLLEHLTTQKKFKDLNPNKKAAKITSFIHLIPLAKHIGASWDSLAKHVLDFEKDLVSLAESLIRQTIGQSYASSLDQVLKILDEAGMTSYQYHGTNVHALATMESHGLGSNQRDYDPELLIKINAIAHGASGLDTHAFFVSGDPLISYEYAIVSPEWFYMTPKLPDNSSAEDRVKYEQIAQKYRSATEVALLQIQMEHTPNPERRKLGVTIANSTGYQYEIVRSFVSYQNNDHKICNDDFNPIRVVVYRLPKQWAS